MARIRTIKPEFPQSESMGKVSRDARLLFVQMWTLADDSGRLRGNSRMLASLLFPYDDDAPGLISGWLSELEREKCIIRYEGPDQSNYVQICKWLSHQKIDKPSESKIPSPESCHPREPSRKVANPLESSIPSRARADQDQGPGEDQGEDQGSFFCFELGEQASKPKSEVLKAPVELTDIKFVLSGGQDWFLPKYKLAQYEATYPTMDVRAELRKVVQWSLDNVKNRKTEVGIVKHIGGWLANAQNKRTAVLKAEYDINPQSRFTKPTPEIPQIPEDES